jgi:uncharacterized membrane protein YfcA
MQNFVSLDLAALAIAGVVFVLAGMVKGLVGLGLPTLSMGLLTLLMPPAAAASLIIVPSFVTNVWQLGANGRWREGLRRFWTLGVGIVIGTLASPLPSLAAGSALATPAVGAALIIYGGLGFVTRPAELRLSAHRERWLSLLVGWTTGAISAATGVFVLPAVPYVKALGLEKADLIQALGLAFTVATLALALALYRDGGALNAPVLLSSAALLPALVGMAIGGALRNRLGERAFRRVFDAGLIALGAYMVAR